MRNTNSIGGEVSGFFYLRVCFFMIIIAPFSDFWEARKELFILL